MPVFISHRTRDDALAKRVHRRLVNEHQIQCYIDDFDIEARTSSAREITRLILSRLENCTHLLAIVTINTEGSWWVPFEIGVARRAPRVITTYTDLLGSSLPEYLNEWPVLRGNSAIDTFAQQYRMHQSTAHRLLLERAKTTNDEIRFVDDAHQKLKAAL